MATVKPVPDGYHTLTPYLFIKGASEAIEFYKNAFGAIELGRMSQPDGKVAHAEIQIGDSRVMLSDEQPPMGALAPLTVGGSPVMLHLYVDDVDRMFSQAVRAGATIVRPVKDEFYGDRAGGLKDPFGHLWHISTHKEDLTPEEIEQRAAKAMSGAEAS
jgi:PhnB protein